jgi:hypothetical protein
MCSVVVLAMDNQVTGLWHLPSFLNHSCVANASVDFLGDMLFVFAKEDIGKSDEITINYFGDNKRVSRTRTDVSTLRSMGLNVIVDCVSSTREINNCNDVSKW